MTIKALFLLSSRRLRRWWANAMVKDQKPMTYNISNVFPSPSHPSRHCKSRGNPTLGHFSHLRKQIWNNIVCLHKRFTTRPTTRRAQKPSKREKHIFNERLRGRLSESDVGEIEIIELKRNINLRTIICDLSWPSPAPTTHTNRTQSYGMRFALFYTSRERKKKLEYVFN